MKNNIKIMIERRKKLSKQKMGSIILVIVVILIIAGLFIGYNIYRYPAMFRNLSDESLDDEEVNHLLEEKRRQEEINVLVAYFSYSGTTENVAKVLGSKISADLFAKEEYTNPYTQGNSEIRNNQKPELKNTVDDMSQYDVIFVGFPIWFHATPAPINSFLESYDLTDKIIIPFCTSGGSDIDEAMPTFLNSCKDLAIYGERRILSSSQIDSWLEEINLIK